MGSNYPSSEHHTQPALQRQQQSPLSMYAYLYVPSNFNSTPLAPPDTRVVAYLDPTQCGTWDLNGEVKWYVGPAMNHYRCVEIYFSRTCTTRVCNTVSFFLHKIPFLQVTTADHL